MARGDDDNAWHLDKKVPIAMIFAIVGQLAGFAWIASKLDSRVESLEKSDVRHERSIDALTAERDGSRERLTRLESQSVQAIELLRALDAKVDRLWRPPAQPH